MEASTSAKKADLDVNFDNNIQDVEGMSPKVFISYASQDFPIYQLKQQGLQPWLDCENLCSEVDWD